MDTTILTLVRHGQTSANTDGVWHGSTDTKLSEEGLRQAQRVAEGIRRRFAPAAIYASDLERARLTAEAIGAATAQRVQIDPGLREYDLGAWEGRPYRELYEKEQLWERMSADPDYAPHGGESPATVARRVGGTLRAIVDRHRGERVVCVSHGGAISIGLGVLLDGHHSKWDRLLDNCAVAEVAFSPEARLLTFNESWE